MQKWLFFNVLTRKKKNTTKHEAFVPLPLQLYKCFLYRSNIFIMEKKENTGKHQNRTENIEQ